MDKEDIINYVMETPGNSNPAVLGGMLSQYGSSGSGEVFWVTYTYDEDASGAGESEEDIYTCDRTFQEIQEAFNNNKNVIAKDNNNRIYYLNFVDPNLIIFALSGIGASKEGLISLYGEFFEHRSTGNIHYEYFDGTVSPGSDSDPELKLYVNYNELYNKTGGMLYTDQQLTTAVMSQTLEQALQAEKKIIVYGIVNGQKYFLTPIYVTYNFLYLLSDNEEIRFTTIDY